MRVDELTLAFMDLERLAKAKEQSVGKVWIQIRQIEVVAHGDVVPSTREKAVEE